jgi:hypothetical protein
MQRLQIDLLGPSDLDEAHGWSANRFGDRLRIEGVVLVRLDERLDESRRHDSGIMAALDQLACQPLRARTGFHADQRRSRGRKEEEDIRAGEPCPLYDRAVAVEGDQVKAVLADVDTVGRGQVTGLGHQVSSIAEVRPSHVRRRCAGRTIPLLSSPAAWRMAARRLIAERGLSQRHVCRLLEVDPKTVRRPERRGDEAVRARLHTLAGERRRFGYRRLGILLEREGMVMNHMA